MSSASASLSQGKCNKVEHLCNLRNTRHCRKATPCQFGIHMPQSHKAHLTLDILSTHKQTAVHDQLWGIHTTLLRVQMSRPVSVTILHYSEAVPLAQANHHTYSKRVRLQVVQRLRHERWRVAGSVAVQLRPGRAVCHSGDTGRREAVGKRLVEGDQQAFVATVASVRHVPLQLRNSSDNTSMSPATCLHDTAAHDPSPGLQAPSGFSDVWLSHIHTSMSRGRQSMAVPAGRPEGRIPARCPAAGMSLPPHYAAACTQQPAGCAPAGHTLPGRCALAACEPLLGQSVAAQL